MSERFPIEASHIMMFARSIGDPNPIFDCTVTEPGDMVAPPTFAQSSAQFDPDYPLRPKPGEPRTPDRRFPRSAPWSES